MKHRALALLAVSLVVFTACASPGHADDAAALRDELTTLPGVTFALIDYAKPVTLDSGKLQATVEVEPTASTEQLVTVITTAYTAFDGAHNGEETDLDVRRDDDTIHLRGFQPDADVADVRRAAADAASVLTGAIARDAEIRAEINTQDVAKAPHVETRYRVDVPGGPPAITAILARLQAAHAQIDHAAWTVQEGEGQGWALGAEEHGFPTEAQHQLWTRLRAGTPKGTTVRVAGPYATMVLPPGTSPAVAASVARRDVALLGGTEHAGYELQVGPASAVLLLSGECHFGDDEVARAVERAVAGGCSQVLHPGEQATEPAPGSDG